MKEIVQPDVLFVNPCLPTLPKEVVSTPFGLSWISAVLKQEGISIKMLEGGEIMADDSFKQIEDKSKKEEKKGPPPHDLPPHLLRELFDLKEKVGRLEGQMDVLLRLKDK